MGNNQPSENERRRRDAILQASLERTLENQRQLYEQRCRQLLQDQAQSLPQTNNVSLSERGQETATNTRDHRNVIYPNLSQVAPVPHTPSPLCVVNHVPSYDMNHDHRQQNTASTSTNYNSKLVNDAMSRALPSAPPQPSIQSRRSRAQTSNNNNSSSGTELNCPTCGNKFGVYIYQCSNGHSSCRECKFTSGICRVSMCGKIITDIRNIALEAYIADLTIAAAKTSHQRNGARKQTLNLSESQRKINCSNKHDGCCLRFSIQEMDNHLKECPFKEMVCPLAAIFGRCSWRGKLNQLDSHFTEVHQEHRRGNVDFEMTILNIGTDSRTVYLVLIGTYNFLIHVKIDIAAQIMYMAAQLIGSNFSAAKWYYEFHIYNKSQPRRKYLYSDVCLSNTRSIDDIFENKNCAVVPLAYAKTFKNNNSLNYKFYLKKQ